MKKSPNRTTKSLLFLILLMAATGAKAQYTAIPDPNFEQALIDLNHDDILDGEVLTANISGLLSLDVSNQNIEDLTGIADFVALTSLNCSNNPLTDLDVSANTALTTLLCYFNQLTDLDVSFNIALTGLGCGYNQLTDLDVSANTALTDLYCYNNQLTDLDVSANTALLRLQCHYNQLTDLDINNNIVLIGLACWNNQLTDLDVSANTVLRSLNCWNNQLTALDLTTNTALEVLDCAHNQLTDLDMSANTALKYFECGNNQLTDLDMTNNTDLIKLYCSDNQLTSLDVSTNIDLTDFTCINNPDLDCIQVADAVAANIPDGIYIDWQKDNTATYSENCNNGQTYVPDDNFEQVLIDQGYDVGPLDDYVPTANISGVAYLNVSHKNIADLTGIEDFVALINLSCYNNDLTSLDFSGHTELKQLFCQNNDLTSLVIAPSLTVLRCYFNKLVSLDVSAATDLIDLRCSTNPLTSLDVSANLDLDDLYIQQSEITELNLSNNLYLTSMVATQNPNLTCIQVDDEIAANGGQGNYANWYKDMQAIYGQNCQSQTYVPDDHFEQALIDLGYDVGPLDDYVPTANISGIINLNVSNESIADLTGIEDFVALQDLNCNNNQLTDLDVSANAELTSLQCQNNQLTALDLTNNTDLTTLDCSDNPLTSLDVSANTALTHLYCEDNQLTSLDVSTNINVTDFSCINNPDLDCIQVDDAVAANGGQGIYANWQKDNTAIYSENCHYGETYVPDDHFEQALIDLGYDVGPLDDYVPTANISGIINLNVGNESIADLTGIEDFVALQDLNCNNNQLTDLDVSANAALINLYCEYNQLADLDVSTNTALTTLICYINKLTDLDISANAALTSLDCSGNPLMDLDVSNNTALIDLFCNGNQLTDLDLSTNTALSFLQCHNNQLTDLDLSTNTALTLLQCHNNQLTALDLTNNTALEGLHCTHNQLADLDVSANTALTFMRCAHNPLTDLDVSTNTALNYLDCANNQLTDLDISANTALTHLYCEDNQLTSLDVSTNIDLTSFLCTNNPDLYCIKVDDEEKANLGLDNYEDWLKDMQAIYSETCLPNLTGDNECSEFGEFTLQGIDPENLNVSCWIGNAPYAVSWHTFQATTTEIEIQVKTGGQYGTMQNAQLALWDENDTELACNHYSGAETMPKVFYQGLTPSHFYTIAITGTAGTFTLCLDNEVSYDFVEGAKEIVNIHDYCSGQEEFSTLGMTIDQQAASCWNEEGPYHNVWFKFQATSSEMMAQVQLPNIQDNLTAPQIALWDANLNELDCSHYQENPAATISYQSLDIGQSYYISVDGYGINNQGFFVLCTDDELVCTDAPQVGFSFENTCVNNQVSFTNLSTGEGLLVYDWDFGDGTSSTEVNPEKIYASSGEFNVKLTVTSDKGCEETLTQVVSIYALPEVDFSFENTCMGDTISFTNLSTGEEPLVYDWDFGDGTSSTEANPEKIYADPGDYQVELTVTSAQGCIASKNSEITISQNHIITVNKILPTTCQENADGKITFSVSGGLSPYSYEIKDANDQVHTAGNTVENTEVNISNFSAGNYILTVTDEAELCSPVQQNFTIQNGGPVASVCAASVACTAPNNGSVLSALSITVTRLALLPGDTYNYEIKDNNDQLVANGSGIFDQPIDPKPEVPYTGENYKFTVLTGADNLCSPINTEFSVQPATLSVVLDQPSGIYNKCEDNQQVDVMLTPALSATSCVEVAILLYDLTIEKDGQPYQVLNDQESPVVLEDMPQGQYEVSLTGHDNAIGPCTAFTTFQVGESFLEVEVSAVDPTCHDPGDNGKATAQVTGGTPPYIYEWYQDQTLLSTLSEVNNLSSGTYRLELSGGGCAIPYITEFEITAPTPLGEVTIQPPAGDCDMTATLTNAGGTAPYTFHWIAVEEVEQLENIFNENTQEWEFGTITVAIESIVFIDEEVPAQGGSAISYTSTDAVKPGNVKVKVTDSYGCEVESATVEIVQPPVVREYALCFRWKTPAIEENEVPANPVVISGATIAATSMNQSIQSQAESCIANQTASFAGAYTSYCLSADYLSDVVTLNYNLATYHHTLYYYDRAGSLVHTVPPKGVRPLTGGELSRDNTPAHELVTDYHYNNLGQLLRQNTPDGGEARFIYNNVAQLRFSQNDRQALDNTISYSKYDELARIVEVGEAELGIDYLYDNQIFTTNTFAELAEESLLALDKETYQDLPIADRYPTVNHNLSEQTITMYSRPINTVDYNGEKQTYLRNRISAVTAINANGETVNTYYSYDPHGNVQWLQQDIPGLGQNQMGYDYDLLSRSVLKVKYNEGKADPFFHRYTYDEDNRIIGAFTSHDNVIWEQDAAYSYFDHGPLKRTVIGKNKVQSMDYAYTLQGWLKSINNPAAGPVNANGSADDAFGMVLGYYAGDFQNQGSTLNSGQPGSDHLPALEGRELYNGNISSWQLATRASDSTWMRTGFQYVYDKLNRIRSSNFNVQKNEAFLARAGFGADFTLDPNGNLNTLDRNDIDGKNMDALEYHLLSASNKLGYVDDHSTLDADKHKGDLEDQDEGNYEYDAIGNLIRDHQEDMDIAWTVSGKVRHIQKPDNESIDFLYDAMGNRVTKRHTDEHGNINTNYYMRDASGNVMAIYRQQEVSGQDPVLELLEVPIYGTDRLGSYQPAGGFDNGTVLNTLVQNDVGISAYQGTSYDLKEAVTLTLAAGFTFESEADNSVFSIGTAGSPEGQLDKKVYELKDHLGNVRAVVTDRKIGDVSEGAPDETMPTIASVAAYYPYGMDMPTVKWGEEEYFATYEAENVLDEYTQFLNYLEADRVHNDLFNHTECDGCLVDPGHSQLLTAHAGSIIGLTKSLKVQAGDHVAMEVYGKYLAPDQNASPSNVVTLLGTSLVDAFNIPNDLEGVALQDFFTGLFAGGSVFVNNGNPVNVSAYLNYMLFDADYMLLDMGYTSLTDVALEDGSDIDHQKLALEVPITEDGYIYIYLSNESAVFNEVYFDDFKITHEKLVADKEYSTGLVGYRYGYQGSEKDDEIKGDKNHYTTFFRQYDPRLGRWFSIDPKSMPYESSYVSMGNNPILYNDPLGDKIKNAHKEKRDKLKATRDAKKKKLDEFGVDAKGKDFRKAKRKFNQANRAYQKEESRFQATESAINDLKKNNPDLYNELDNLTDPGGDIVDVFVHVESGLYSDRFSNNFSDFQSRKKLDGLTQTSPQGNTVYVKFGSSKYYYKFSSTLHGDNTITIIIDASVIDKGRVLSHEGGHGLYNVKNLKQYIEWLRANPGKSSGGHGGGNPSGQAADKQEQIYINNR